MRSRSFGLSILGCALSLGGCSTTPSEANNAGIGGFAGSGAPLGGMGGPVAGAAGTPVGGGGAGSAAGAGSVTAGTGGTTAGTGGASTSGTGGTAPPPGECATSDDIMTGATCADNANGIFAIKTVIDVWWKDDAEPPLVDPGRDKITVYLMGEISGVCPDGSGGVGVMKGCGTELPPFKSDANCDVFQIMFPDELWDQPTMPTFTTTGMTTGFEPSDFLSIATATGLIGIELADENGTWPTPLDTATLACPAGTGAQCFPDHDGDGKPGVTIRMGRVGEMYSPDGCGADVFNPVGNPFVYRGAPLDPLSALDDNSVRADILQIGLRTRLGGGGEIGADCSSGVGDSNAEFLDSRVYDCQRTDSQNCAPAQAQFVDEQAPTYNILNVGEAPPPEIMTMGSNSMQLDQTPSVGTRSALVRLGDVGGSFSCADVRNAAFPAL